MRIEKDAEWLRLEGKVGQLDGDLKAAKHKLAAHKEKVCAAHMGLVLGETIVEFRGDKFLASRVEGSDWTQSLYGRKIRKDGKPADREQYISASSWSKVE